MQQVQSAMKLSRVKSTKVCKVIGFMGVFSAESLGGTVRDATSEPCESKCGRLVRSIEAHVLAHGSEPVDLAPSVSRHLCHLYYSLRGLAVDP